MLGSTNICTIYFADAQSGAQKDFLKNS